MPSVHTVARYVHKADGTGAYIYTPYDPNFVEELKHTVPYYAREWQPSKGKRWFIREDWTTYIDELLHKYFNEVRHEREGEAKSKEEPRPPRWTYAGPEDPSVHVAELEQKVAQLERQLRNAELMAESWKHKYHERKAQDFNRSYNDASDFFNTHFSGAQSNSNPDHYKALHITSDAPDEVVRAAYKAMALKYHPDTNGGSAKATEKMKQVNNAYDRIKRERGWS